MQRLRINCHCHAVALAQLVFSLVSVCACRNESTQPIAPEAVKGVLDLSNISHLTHLAGVGFGFMWVRLRERMPNFWLFNNDPAPFRRGGRGRGGPSGRYVDL